MRNGIIQIDGFSDRTPFNFISSVVRGSDGQVFSGHDVYGAIRTNIGDGSDGANAKINSRDSRQTA